MADLEQFSFIELFVTIHGVKYDGIEAMHAAATVAYNQFKPHDGASYYQQAHDFLQSLGA